MGYIPINAWFFNKEKENLIECKEHYILTIDKECLMNSKMAKLLRLEEDTYMSILINCGAIKDLCQTYSFPTKETAETAIITFRLMR